MKYMVEIRLKSGSKDKVMESFELRGPNRNPGVTYKGGWIATREEVVFVLVESDDDTSVEQALKNWNPPADVSVYPVIDIDQY